MKTVVRHTAGRQLSAMLMLSASLLLMGCQSKTAKLEAGDPLTTASTSEPSFKKTAEIGERWKADQSNVELGLAYAEGLGKIGQGAQQLDVYQTLATKNPENKDLKSIYGKALIEVGRPGEATAVLEPLASSGKADWKTLSALGSAYDQDGQHAKARQVYQKALALQPDELSVLNNMGMSHALEGNLPTAEKVLREALAKPESRRLPRIRQNLALVVGLQGRFDESREIASADLPPDEVEANLAYLQKMLSQPNTWKQLSSEGSG